jgi:hypothetical protein
LLRPVKLPSQKAISGADAAPDLSRRPSYLSPCCFLDRHHHL